MEVEKARVDGGMVCFEDDPAAKAVFVFEERLNVDLDERVREATLPARVAFDVVSAALRHESGVQGAERRENDDAVLCDHECLPEIGPFQVANPR